MKLLFRIFIVLTCVFQLACKNVQAQQNLVYSHYFLNPFLYNPSFVAPNGYSEVYLNYRNQWSGIEGAPTTGTISVHLPLNYKAGLAFTGYQDKAGALKTTTGLVTFAYQVYLGNSVADNHKLAFGLSAGMTSVSIDPGDVNVNDPVVGTTSSLEGQFGMHYQFKNLKVAFAIPRLLNTYVASDKSFNKVGVAQIKTTISSLSYTIKLSEHLTFEPIATYRTYENTKGQYEGLGVLRVNNIVWFGGSYRQGYGATGFVGFNIKDKWKLGYAYEFATDQVNTFGAGTHEIQLALRLGKKKFSRSESKSKAHTDSQPAYEATAEEEPLSEPVNEPEVADASPIESQQYEMVQPSVPAQPEKSSAPVIRKEVIEASPAEQLQKETVQSSTPVLKQSEKSSVPVKPVISNKVVTVSSATSQPMETENQPVQAVADTDQKKEAVRSLSGEGLAPGHYVVVGAFRDVQNATNYTRTLKQTGYPADIAYHPEKGYYIVHMINAPTLSEAQQLRDKYREMSRYSFRDTWILSIE